MGNIDGGRFAIASVLRGVTLGGIATGLCFAFPGAIVPIAIGAGVIWGGSLLASASGAEDYSDEDGFGDGPNLFNRVEGALIDLVQSTGELIAHGTKYVFSKKYRAEIKEENKQEDLRYKFYYERGVYTHPEEKEKVINWIAERKQAFEDAHKTGDYAEWLNKYVYSYNIPNVEKLIKEWDNLPEKDKKYFGDPAKLDNYKSICKAESWSYTNWEKFNPKYVEQTQETADVEEEKISDKKTLTGVKVEQKTTEDIQE